MPDLKDLIRTIPDFPKAGIMYRDITTLLSDAHGLAESIRQLAAPYKGLGVTAIAGIDARGFIFGTGCLLYTSPSPRDKRQSRMPSSA